MTTPQETRSLIERLLEDALSLSDCWAWKRTTFNNVYDIRLLDADIAEAQKWLKNNPEQ